MKPTDRKIEQGADRCIRAELDPSRELILESLLQASPDAIVAVDSAGRILLVNGQAERMTGYRSEELVGQPIEVLVPDSVRHLHVGHRERYLTDPHPRPMGPDAELAVRCKDGSEMPAEISLNALDAGDDVVVTAAIRDVAQRKHFESVLREKNDALEQAVLTKDAFLASMSHELRTPLNAIIGFSGTMLMGLPGTLNAEQERQLRTIQSNARNLHTIIDGLLNLAKLDSGHVSVSSGRMDCSKVAERIVEEMRPLADAKGLRLSLEIPPTPAIADSDPMVLRQIMRYLVDNAIKYTVAGDVFVSVGIGTGSDRRLLLTVRDTGPGIRTQRHDDIFEPFDRGAIPGNSGPSGIGLGLYLSRRLADLVGATIELASEAGVGTTATVIPRPYTVESTLRREHGGAAVAEGSTGL